MHFHPAMGRRWGSIRRVFLCSAKGGHAFRGGRDWKALVAPRCRAEPGGECSQASSQARRQAAASAHAVLSAPTSPPQDTPRLHRARIGVHWVGDGGRGGRWASEGFFHPAGTQRGSSYREVWRFFKGATSGRWPRLHRRKNGDAGLSRGERFLGRLPPFFTDVRDPQA